MRIVRVPTRKGALSGGGTTDDAPTTKETHVRDELKHLLSTYGRSAAGDQCGLHELLADLHVLARERELNFWGALNGCEAEHAETSLDAFDPRI